MPGHQVAAEGSTSSSEGRTSLDSTREGAVPPRTGAAAAGAYYEPIGEPAFSVGAGKWVEDDDGGYGGGGGASGLWAPTVVLQFAIAVNRFFQYNVLVDLFNNATLPTQFFAMACLLWVLGAEAATPYLLGTAHGPAAAGAPGGTQRPQPFDGSAMRLVAYFAMTLCTVVASLSYIVILFYMALSGDPTVTGNIRPANLLAAAVTQTLLASLSIVSMCIDACEPGGVRGSLQRRHGGGGPPHGDGSDHTGGPPYNGKGRGAGANETTHILRHGEHAHLQAHGRAVDVV